jgi:ParB-like chromosome segregation protein Spo0J
LCRILPDGKLEVVSGNHRIKASIQAKIKQVFVMVILREISQGDKIAIQLSHNSLTGEDDVNIW